MLIELLVGSLVLVYRYTSIHERKAILPPHDGMVHPSGKLLRIEFSIPPCFTLISSIKRAVLLEDSTITSFTGR